MMSLSIYYYQNDIVSTNLYGRLGFLLFVCIILYFANSNVVCR